MVVPVQVAVRLRPPNPDEDVVISFVPDSKQILIDGKSVCSADYIFPPDSSQGFIYDACLVNRINFLFEGHDIFIIAFGKCRSGKTHTLFQLNCTGFNVSYGIVPLAVHHIFNTLSRFQVHNYFRYSVYINFFEVVDGDVHDLLTLYPDDNDSKKYSLSFTNKGSTVVNGVENILCRNVNEVFGCLQIGLQSKIGNKNQHKDCNSHTFFVITVYQQWIYNGGCENKVSKATFIDLGGYDSVLSENKSDTCTNFLADILDYVSEGRSQSQSVDESFLPILIRDAFTVSSSTLLICCLSPGSKDASESVEHLQLINKIRENYYISDGLSNYVCDSATEASSQELEYYTLQQDMYVSLVTSQWMKLVANAEGLFQKLAQSGIPKEAQQQIENWLCLKQEYDECFLESPNIQKSGKSLECIEEESERNSSSCLTSLNSENEISELVVQKIEFTTTIKNESRRPLDVDSPCTTKDGYSSKSESCPSRCNEEPAVSEDRQSEAPESNDGDSKKNSLNSSPIYRRRKTLMPEDVNYVLSKFGGREGTSNQNESSDTEEDNDDNLNLEVSGNAVTKYDKKKKSFRDNRRSSLKVGNCDSDSDCDCSLSDNDLPLVKSPGKSKALVLKKDELKVLSTAAESKQAQINLIILDLEGAHERIEELNEIIRIKEEYITDMIDQSNVTSTAKAKLQKKLYKLEEEYFKTRANLIKAEKAVKKGDVTALNQIEKYKLLSDHYEKRLSDLKTIKQLAGDSAKKIFELESSLCNSKRKLQKLLKQIKKEEDYKKNLERELESDKKRVQELEEKLSNCYLSDQSCDSVRSKKIQIEEKRLKTLQESSQVLQEQLNKQKYLLMKREGFLKEKSQSKCTCIANLDEPSDSKKLEGTINDQVREELRLEIRNLRKTRECLVEQRRKLDRKFKKEKLFTPEEERHFLECDEAVEAIDSAIEYKNEIMFGHLQSFDNREDWEHNDELLIERLMKLSHPELRTLFTKYFRKVIDLRESGRKLEQLISEQDVQIEAQAWKVQTLSNALQQSRIESERRLIMVHREHQEKLHLMLRQYATLETSGASSTVELDSDKLYIQNSNKLYLQNKELKHRVVELEGMLTHKRPSPSTSNVISTALTIPHENINKLPNKPAFITKVTRQKNKLIIQQQKTKKRSK